MTDEMEEKPWTAPGLSPEDRKREALKHLAFGPSKTGEVLLETIEAAVRDAAPKWTAVEDGLPQGIPEEDWPELLEWCAIITDGKHSVGFFNRWYGIWQDDDKNIEKPGMKINGVTHWTALPPLPESPRELA